MTWGGLAAPSSLAWVTPFGFGSPRSSLDGSINSNNKRQDHSYYIPVSATAAAASLQEPSESASQFGRKEYWNDFYRSNPSFSWYTGWNDIEPFLQELITPNNYILIPGVGNDAMLVDMYDAGYHHLTAFDYAPEGIECCRELLLGGRDGTKERDVELFVGDARDLPHLEDASFDVVLEKGTLDAILLSGGGGKEENKMIGMKHMEMAVAELSRVLKPGGLFISLSAICTEALQASPNWTTMKSDENSSAWEVVHDGSLYFTDDGYASNNFDGDLLVWRKR